jgi:hypothetical protein
MIMSVAPHVARFVLLSSIVINVAGCKDKPSAASDTAPRPEPSSIPSAGPSAAPPAAKRVPTVVLSSPGADFASARLHAVDGAILVSQERRVGRIAGNAIEWLGSVPAAYVTAITSVHGHYPDSLDVLYTSQNGRAVDPLYHSLSGKARPASLGGGGVAAYFLGVAYVGPSTVLAGWEMSDGYKLMTVRGPAVARPLTSPEKAGCASGEAPPEGASSSQPGVTPSKVAGTPGGVLLSLGSLCSKRPAVEIWDKDGPSRIVDLAKQLPEKVDLEAVLRGKGEELFVVAGSRNPVLRFDGNGLQPLPRLDKPLRNVAVSQQGQLYASDGEVIRKLDEGVWTPVARLGWPVRFEGMAIDGDTIWVGSAGATWTLKEGGGVTYEEGCAAPFVYLYDVSPKNDAKFTYPATQKALSTFPDVASLTLIEVLEAGVRRLGISVTSKAQGEAVVAHIRANMKDEDPKLLCYEPKGGRKIPLKAK